MGFNYLKARMKTTLRGQFTFYNYVSGNCWYSFFINLITEGQTTQILKSDPKKGVSVIDKMLFPQVDEGFWLYYTSV